MMNKVLAILLSFGLVMLTGLPYAQAQDDTTEMPTWTAPSFDLPELRYPDQHTIPEGARIVPLDRRDRAPFSGVLWNSEAAAWSIADYQAVQRFWIAEMELRLDLTRAWAIFELESLWNRYERDTQVLRLEVQSRDEDISDLRAINEELSVEVGFTRREKFLTVTITFSTALAAGLLGFGLGKVLR